MDIAFKIKRPLPSGDSDAKYALKGAILMPKLADFSEKVRPTHYACVDFLYFRMEESAFEISLRKFLHLGAYQNPTKADFQQESNFIACKNATNCDP